MISYLKELNSKYHCYFIRGNREEYILNYLNSSNKNWSLDNRNGPMFCTLNELTKNDIKFIKELPQISEIHIDGISPIYITHKLSFVKKDYKYVLFGHTHIPEHYINNGIHYINPGSVGLGLSNNFCSEFAILNIDNNRSKVQFINLTYNIDQILQAISKSRLSKTRIQWDIILKKTIIDGIDYSSLYIKKVLEKAEKRKISNLDDIPMELWDVARNELFK